MSKIQRWQEYGCDYDGCEGDMEEVDVGDYVNYADHLAAIKELTEENTRLRALYVAAKPEEMVPCRCALRPFNDFCPKCNGKGWYVRGNKG